MIADDQKIELPGVEGVLLYKDFFNPDVYYYSSTRPMIARQDGEYQFTLALYEPPGDGLAGMLSFVVDLEPDESTIELARSRLRDRNPGAELKQMPWTSGNVAAAIIGGDPAFGVPSLIGRNSAVISMGLTASQYILLKESLDRPSSQPISIVYQLTYDAFRQAYGYSIEFDAQNFRNWVQQKCTANLLFISFEDTRTFEELKQRSVLRVHSFNQTGDEPPAGFKRAFLASLRNALRPLPKFAPPPEGGDDGWLIGFDCTTVRDVQNLTRRLDMQMTVSGAVERSAFIQGTIANLAAAWKARPAIPLPTGFTFKQNLTVRCTAAYDGLPLRSAAVVVVKGAKPAATRVFNNERPGDWQVELVHDPKAPATYSLYCELALARIAEKVVSAPNEIERGRAFVDVVPAEHYAYRRFAVLTPADFPWELVQSISITSASTPNSLTPSTLQLTPQRRSGEIVFLSLSQQALEELALAVSYLPVNGKAIEDEVLPSGCTIFLNPFQSRTISFGLSEAFQWGQKREIKVVLRGAQRALAPTGPVIIGRGDSSAAYTYWYTDRNSRTLQFRTSADANSNEWKTVRSTLVTIPVPAVRTDAAGIADEMERAPQ